MKNDSKIISQDIVKEYSTDGVTITTTTIMQEFIPTPVLDQQIGDLDVKIREVQDTKSLASQDRDKITQIVKA